MRHSHLTAAFPAAAAAPAGHAAPHESTAPCGADAAAASDDIYVAAVALAAVLEEYGMDIYNAIIHDPTCVAVVKQLKLYEAELKTVVDAFAKDPEGVAKEYKEKTEQIKAQLDSVRDGAAEKLDAADGIQAVIDAENEAKESIAVILADAKDKDGKAKECADDIMAAVKAHNFRPENVYGDICEFFN